MEIARNPEELRQMEIMELEKSVNDLTRLLSDKLVSRAAREALEPRLAEDTKKLANLKGIPEEQEKIAA